MGDVASSGWNKNEGHVSYCEWRGLRFSLIFFLNLKKLLKTKILKILNKIENTKIKFN